ncbi:MAG: PAS domain S-box protein [Thermodesulfobacteriota bacterium]
MDRQVNKSFSGPCSGPEDGADPYGLLATHPYPAFVLGADRTIREVNQAMVDALAAPARELIGHPCRDSLCRKNGSPDQCPFSEMIRSGCTANTLVDIPALGGINVVVCAPVPEGTGEVGSGLILTYPLSSIDFSILGARTDFFRFLSMPAALVTQGKIRSSSRPFQTLFGVTGEGRQASGRVEDLVMPEDAKAFLGLFSAKNQQAPGGFRFKTRFGPMISLSAEVLPLAYRKGAAKLLVIHGKDGSPLEDALGESEARFRAIAEAARDWVFSKDAELRYTYVNPAMAHSLGVPVADFLDHASADIFEPESAAAMERLDNNALEGSSSDAEIPLSIKGRAGFFHVIKVPLRDGKGRVTGVSGIVRDVTGKKAAEQAQREENAFRKAIIKNLSEGLAVCHDTDEPPHLRFTDFNDRMEKITGYSLEEINALGLYQALFPDPALRASAKQRMDEVRGGREMVGEPWSIVNKKGEERDLLVSATVLGEREGRTHVLALVQDVTEKKRIEQEMMRRERLDSLGILAGGVAHDFNNLLMGIQGNVSLMQLALAPGSELSDRCRNIEAYIRDAAALTRQLLGLAGGGKYEVRPLDVNELVQRVTSMFTRSRKGLSVHLELCSSFPVEADASQMEQVLINLLLNAWQAMPRGGEIFVATNDAFLDRDKLSPYGLPAGRFVRISVRDTGPGIPEDILPHIFDPFFTTKEKSRGTGLGLSSADGIVKNHGGFISVASRRNAGSTFNVFLPAARGQAVRKKDQAMEAYPVTGSGVILVVDDEAPVREAQADMLKALGYTVLTAGSGREALSVYTDNKDGIDLVVLDMVMPDLSGGEVFDNLRTLNPEARVLMVSGYSLKETAADLMERGCKGFLQKPYTLEILSHKVNDILTDAGAGAL